MGNCSKSFAAAALMSAILSTPVIADTAGIQGTVKRTLVQPDGAFGGCMALLSVDPASALPSCSPHWVTFSCTGDFADVLAAYRSFDQAQLALAGNHQVYVQIDDGRKHNGYCYAYRIDVLK